ncbi:MAG TPA: hypothetical protein PKY82_29530 [Pyrinomonadaceae bacterium]|nr:hypothetical protein [Pyrinomonadaceae bacterium]
MPDYEWLLERIRQSPKEHLGQISVSRINSYMMGYDMARNFWGLPDVHRRLSWDKFREWQESKFHLCSQNIQSLCILVCENEQQAFDLFFEFHDMALEECRADLVIKEDLEAKNFDQTTATKSCTLIEFILNKEGIRKRPAMYFGNDRQVTGLWTMCNGFLWAEKDLGITDSSDAMNLELFQIWLDERYPFAKGQNWDKLLYFNTIDSNSRALEQFYENFEMFLEGKNTDAPPRWVETMIETVLKDQKAKEE